MMDAEHLYDLARRAANHLRKEWSLEWSLDDRADAIQTAALGVVRALRQVEARQDAVNDGYYFRAGRQEVIRWLLRSWNRQPRRLVPVYVAEDTVIEPAEDGESWSRELDESRLRAIWQLLYESRKKRGARGEAATDRDVAILYLLSRGWSMSMIGEEIGLPRLYVHKYRQNIRDRLKQIAEQKGAQSC